MRHTGTMTKGVTARCLSCSSLLASQLWRALGPELNPGVRATVTLVGAGTVGAFIVLKGVSRLLAEKSPFPDSKQETTSSAPVERILTVPGLQNTGNNCFLNVILQALASSEALLHFMDACAALTTETDGKSQGKSSSGKVAMPLAVAVSSLIKDLSRVECVQRTSSPRRVMLALRLYVQHFDLDSQQDAAEALIHLASALQEERGKFLEWLRPTFQSFVEAPVLDETSAVIGGRTSSSRLTGGDQLLDSWRGHLPWPLEGTIASSLTCQRCGYQFATQFQSFNDITLTPLCDREGNLIRGCSLESCLDHFTRPEWVESVKCSHCSHKAALLSIFLNSGDSKLTPVIADRIGTQKVSRNRVKCIEECGCDEDCKCETLAGEEGCVWKNIYTNASKELKIGRSPQVICFQIQRVVMSHDGTIKKLTGHVTFPRVLDLFPYTVAAKDSIPLREHINKSINQDLSFSKERLSPRSYHSSFTTEGDFVNMPSLLHAEVNCKGGADFGHPAVEDPNTIGSYGKEGSGEENNAIKAEAGSEKMRSTFVTASASLSNIDIIRREERASEDISAEPVSECGPHSKKVGVSALPSHTDDHAIQVVPRREDPDHALDNLSITVAVTPSSRNEECAGQNDFHMFIKPTSPRDGIFVHEVSNHQSDLVENFQSVQLSSPTNGGVSTPTSNVVESIYSQYTPRVFPPILQQLSSLASPYGDPQLSADMHGNGKKLPSVHNMPRKTIRLTPKNPKYSRNLLYQLVSVVVHQGGPQNGHYLVYRKVRLRGSKRNLTNEEVILREGSIGDKRNGESRIDNSTDSARILDEKSPSAPDLKVSGAEGDEVQADVCQLFELESLPDITSSERLKPSRSRVQVSEDQELMSRDASSPDKSQTQRTCGTLLEECANCTGICGRREDSDALWFRISDTHVQRVPEQEVFGAQASLLFYEQV